MKILLYALLCLLSLKSYSQSFNSIAIKAGSSISGRSNVATNKQDGNISVGLVFTVEPTILSFGTKKQFDFNTDLSFIQKGFQKDEKIYSYNAVGESLGIGSESYLFKLNYITLSPVLKYNFAKILFIKAGPRVDILAGYNYRGRPNSDSRRGNEFNEVTAGITYGAGICLGKNKLKFIAELMAQNDFTNSSYNKVEKAYYRNFSYYINCGISINIGKKSSPPAGVGAL